MVRGAAAKGNTFKSLGLGVVESVPFQMREVQRGTGSEAVIRAGAAN